jgi:protein arginine kinase activator
MPIETSIGGPYDGTEPETREIHGARDVTPPKKGDCEGCKKPSTNTITEISNGKIVEKNYCDSCPKLMGESMGGAKAHTPINELLNNFVLAHSGTTKEVTAACEACGIAWSDFKQSGLLGCENDYAVFEKDLATIIQRAHEGATHHLGKVPTRKAGGSITTSRKRTTLAKLRKELAAAIEQEDYERAASLRDQIRAADATED